MWAGHRRGGHHATWVEHHRGRGTRRCGRGITGAGHHECCGVRLDPDIRKGTFLGSADDREPRKVPMRATPTRAVSSGQGGPAGLSEVPWPTASLTHRPAWGCAFAVGVFVRVLHRAWTARELRGHLRHPAQPSLVTIKMCSLAG